MSAGLKIRLKACEVYYVPGKHRDDGGEKNIHCLSTKIVPRDVLIIKG